MRIDILKDVASLVAGEKAKGIVDVLFGKQNVNEFLISKKLKMTINSTRNMLYKLADEGLVSFVRKKDNKKGGWYTYFWTLNEDKGLLRFKEGVLNKINLAKNDMGVKQNQRFYYCPNCNLEFNEEESLLRDYTCPECGEILQLKDNSKEVVAISKEIAKNEELLGKVNVEIALLDEKNQKVKEKKIKAEEKKKKEEREVKKKVREKEKALMKGQKKTNTKKTTKKK